MGHPQRDIAHIVGVAVDADDVDGFEAQVAEAYSRRVAEHTRVQAGS